MRGIKCAQKKGVCWREREREYQFFVAKERYEIKFNYKRKCVKK